jgi:hypothetical protein
MRLSLVLPQAGQAQAGSCSTRSRGKCAGSGWRPRGGELVDLGLSGAAAGSLASCSASSASSSPIKSSSCSIRSDDRP